MSKSHDVNAPASLTESVVLISATYVSMTVQVQGDGNVEKIQ